MRFSCLDSSIVPEFVCTKCLNWTSYAFKTVIDHNPTFTKKYVKLVAIGLLIALPGS